MADKRMFSKSITDSDAFLTMPMSSQCLYFHLNMKADDDGFVNSPRSVQKLLGASDDDMKILIMKKFVITFENGIIVIKHWRINNYLRSDRYKETNYTREKSTLLVDENGAYTQPNHSGIPVVYPDKNSIEKISIDKSSIEGPLKNIIPPTVDMVTDYCTERHNQVDPNQFFDFYEAKGWKVGKEKMKDWQACVRTWEKRETKKGGNSFIGILSEYED